MSKVNSLHHIVINTKHRMPTLVMDNIEHLYRFIWSRINRRGSKLVRIGGIENHVHFLVDLSSSDSLADLMRDIKQLSSKWAKESGLFPKFQGWGREYFAFSVGYREKEIVIDYINNQVKHHTVYSYEEEMQHITFDEGIEFEDFMFT